MDESLDKNMRGMKDKRKNDKIAGRDKQLLSNFNNNCGIGFIDCISCCFMKLFYFFGENNKYI